jgi:peptidyl-prolyl cis-trans isomerase C
VISWVTGRKGMRTTLLGLFVLLVAGAGKIGYERLNDLPDDAVLRYDDRDVTENELQERVDILSALYGVQRPDDADEAESFDRDAAKSMAVSLIMEEATADRDITISDRVAQTQLDKLIDDQLVGGRSAFVDFLTEAGISEQDVLDEIKRQLATSALVEEVVADVPKPTDAEIREAYVEHHDQMATPEARRLRNIVVERKVDARRVAQLARSGQNFARLAGTWSRDGSTRNKGGYLGLVTAAQLDATYAETAFAAKKGEVFGPVRTQYGWNVGLVVDIVQTRQLDFADVKQEMREELHTKARLDLWRDYLGDLLDAADVEYAEDYRPDDPTAPPSGQNAPTKPRRVPR